MRSTKLPSWTERLLGFDPLPVPPHVFVLDERGLRYGQFLRQGGGFRFRSFRSAAVPGDAFHSGPLGGPPRDPRAFAELVAGFVREVPGVVRDASLVIPDAWLRVTFSEVGDLPRAADALDEVLRWKLRRLVPFRVDDLRISATEVTPLPGQEEPRRLLLGFAVESLLAQLEEAFAAAGVRIGLVTNASLALVSALAPAAEAGTPAELWGLALVEEEGYTLVYARGDEPVVHRYKAFTGALPDEARASFVGRDLKLTRNFLDEQFPGNAAGRVVLVSPPELEPSWLERLEQGLGRPATPLDGRQLPPLRAEETTAPWREIAPMLGAARLEVA